MSKKTELPEYQSNPFVICFDSFGRFFNKNVGWAAALIVAATLGLFMQLGSNLFTSASTTTTDRREQQLEQSLGDSESGTKLDGAEIAAIAILISVTLLFVMTTAIVVGSFLQGMFSYVALQSELEKSVGFSEAFNATTQKFWVLLGAQTLAALKIIGWTLLFIIPGIFAMLRYALLPYVIMSDDGAAKKVGESHDRTKQLVKGRLIEVFGIQTVASIIPFIGELLGLTGKAALHQQLQAYDKAKTEKPKPHWLNYLGFILIGLALTLVMLVGLVALILATNK